MLKFLQKAFATFRDFLWLAARNWVSLLGVILATVAAISFLAILALEISGEARGNYMGIISYLILPTIFVVGLVLIPIGLRLQRRKTSQASPPRSRCSTSTTPGFASIGLLVLVLTVANLMIVSTATFKGLEVMHSDAFCGTTCHNVMQPEAVAHLTTTHGNVNCVDCHIGEGASHFVKAKLRGSAQMVEFMFGDYPRPVPQPTAVSSAICAQCHAESASVKLRLHVRRTYGNAEKVVEKDTIFRMLVGGLTRQGSGRASTNTTGCTSGTSLTRSAQPSPTSRSPAPTAVPTNSPPRT